MPRSRSLKELVANQNRMNSSSPMLDSPMQRKDATQNQNSSSPLQGLAKEKIAGKVSTVADKWIAEGAAAKAAKAGASTIKGIPAATAGGAATMPVGAAAAGASGPAAAGGAVAAKAIGGSLLKFLVGML